MTRIIFLTLLMCLAHAGLSAQDMYHNLLQVENTRQFPFTGKLELAQNFPNPVTRTETTTIRYQVADIENVSLVLFSRDNKVVRMFPLTGNSGTVKLQTNDLASGVYVYALLVNGRLVEKKKMVVAM